MPYAKWSEVNDSIKGIEPQVTLAQANGIARCADEVEDVESPWAVCISSFKKSHEVEGDKWVAKDAEAQQYGQLFSIAEFSEGETELLTVQVMQPCSTIERHGRPVTITEDDEDQYAANFAAGLAQQEVPIHIGHPAGSDKATDPAAAWYKRVYTRVIDGVKTVWADVELTSLGRKVLTEKLYKHFSPALDLENKIIVGGAFMNSPAIRGMAPIEMAQFLVPEGDDDTITGRLATVLKALKVLGDYLKPESWQERHFMEQLVGALQAVGWLANSQQEALESGVGEMSEDGTMHLSEEDTMTEKELAELRASIKAELVAEMTEQTQEHAELTESIRAELRVELEAEFAEKAKVHGELSEYVDTITQGEAALSTPPADIIAFLAELSPEQLEAAKALLTAKVVDFSERGHTGASNGLKPLPIEAKASLLGLLKGVEAKAAVVATFAQANDFSLEEYDFSEYLPAE